MEETPAAHLARSCATLSGIALEIIGTLADHFEPKPGKPDQLCFAPVEPAQDMIRPGRFPRAKKSRIRGNIFTKSVATISRP
ncbi:hypothetical protein [Pseudaminobacter salicylatoxidans]|uniref:hypothetical protein n=1 Tax=Pseudaminobacter salicylatoxidans TaxID=93369 RepID=UPI0011B28C52|nr:hypothetical protein [Pseudaminobacter salicylatoxidans]